MGKDDFLKILVAQLQNQDPLEPMKPDQFLSQLSQLTQVEQLQNIASTLTQMKTASDKGSMTQWITAMGKRMNVESSVVSYGDEIYLSPQGDYDKVVLTLKNADGSITEKIINKGEALFYRHDGTTEAAFMAAAVKDGKAVNCTTSVYRVVRGVQIGDSGPVMLAGNGDSYTVDKIKLIKE